MKCKNCSYENKHDGIYCSDCGKSFIEISYPEVCYFIRQEVNIKLEITNPFHESIAISEMVLSGEKYRIEKKIGWGETVQVAPIAMNSKTILKFDFSLTIKRGDRKFSIGNFDTPLILAPLPEIEINPVDSEEICRFSPVTGYSKEFRIALKNETVVKIEGVFLVEAPEDSEGSLFGNPGDKNFWSDKILLPATEIELTPSNPDQKIMVDFSALSGRDTDKKAYNLSIKNLYEADYEILEETKKKKIAFQFLDLVPVTLGILHATDKGFVYVVDNKVIGEHPDDDVKLLGSHHMDCIHFGNWNKKTSQEKAVGERIKEFNNRKILVNIPKGEKRKRRFSLYYNYMGDSEQYDLINNQCHMRIDFKSKGRLLDEYKPNIIALQEINFGAGRTSPVFIGEELSLSDIRDLNAFEITVCIPDECKDKKLLFDLFIIRKNKVTGEIVDEVKYDLEFNVYTPRPLGEYIAIDFGTSNTCIAGPELSNGGFVQGNPLCYPLNCYHEDVDQIHSFPTIIKYLESGNEDISSFFIPDCLLEISDVGAECLHKNFKIKLPEELMEENNFDISPLKLSLDFIEAALCNLSIYFEDRNCEQTVFNQIKFTAPPGFSPELRNRIETALKGKLQKKNNSSDGYAIRMDIDEPLAAFLHVLKEKTISFEQDENKIGMIGVYDFGGGTTDVSFLMKDNTSGIKLVGTGGSIKVGGATIDKWMLACLQAIPDAEEEKGYAYPALCNDNVNNVEATLRFSTMKHNFERELDNHIDVNEDSSNGFPFSIKDSFNAKAIIDGTWENEWNINKDFWETGGNLAEFVILPLYVALYNKIKEIIVDSLCGPLKATEFLPQPVSGIDMIFLLGGNASKIGYIDIMIKQIVNEYRISNEYKKEFPNIDIDSISTVMVDPAKGSVSLGAYHATQMGSWYNRIEKTNNPPMTIFIRSMPFPFKGSKKIEKVGGEDGIVIFREGEKKIVSGRVLIKRFNREEIGIGNERLVPVSRKIGIDISTTHEKILDSKHSEDVVFVLSDSNILKIFSFSNVENLCEKEAFKEATQSGDADYIRKQLGS